MMRKGGLSELSACAQAWEVLLCGPDSDEQNHQNTHAKKYSSMD